MIWQKKFNCKALKIIRKDKIISEDNYKYLIKEEKIDKC